MIFIEANEIDSSYHTHGSNPGKGKKFFAAESVQAEIESTQPHI